MYLLEMNVVVVVVLVIDTVTIGIEVPIPAPTDCVMLDNTRTDDGIPVAMASTAVVDGIKAELLILGCVPTVIIASAFVSANVAEYDTAVLIGTESE